MEAVDAASKPVQSFDWGVIKWFVTPDDTAGANLTFGEVVLLPGKGHDRHNHPESEEILYVLAGEGEQMLDDGGENTLPDQGGGHGLRADGDVPLDRQHRLAAAAAARALQPGRRGEGAARPARFPRGGRSGLGAERMSPTVLLIGTLDTKGDEYAFLRDRLIDAGVDVLLADVGTLEPPRATPDITREEVAAGTGADLAALADARDRGAAVTAMADAAAVLARRLHDEGRIDGVLAAGGSGNTAIATRAMQVLPVGVPKLMVSTMAAGDTRDYVGARDVAMMASVADVAGVNSVSARVLANAAAAMAGMVSAPPVELAEERPLVGATMFGVTTPCLTTAREELERLGYEPVIFHATGVGGQAMEGLMESGFLRGVLDVTTTELCDDLVGGVLSAGPDRLEMAGRLGLPQVVSVGALDMVNFGARDTVPERFEDRNLYVHNPSITLMRTTKEENAELGRRIAAKLSKATGPTALFLPLGGVSMIDAEGQPFHDPEADAALFEELRKVGAGVELVEMDEHVNDPEFAKAMVAKLDSYMRESPA